MPIVGPTPPAYRSPEKVLLVCCSCNNCSTVNTSIFKVSYGKGPQAVDWPGRPDNQGGVRKRIKQLSSLAKNETFRKDGLILATKSLFLGSPFFPVAPKHAGAGRGGAAVPDHWPLLPLAIRTGSTVGHEQPPPRGPVQTAALQP